MSMRGGSLPRWAWVLIAMGSVVGLLMISIVLVFLWPWLLVAFT